MERCIFVVVHFVVRGLVSVKHSTYNVYDTVYNVISVFSM